MAVDTNEPIQGINDRGTIILAAVVFLAMFWIVLAHPYMVNHDCAVNIHIGGIIAGGGLPYVDFFELNPPLIMYLNAIPAAFAKSTGASPIVVFHLTVILLSVFSAWASGRMSAGNNADGIRPGAVMLAWAVFSHVLLMKNGFGQREHLFALGFLPYFLIRWTRYEPGRISTTASLASGVFAALGICLKPHFLLMLLLPELFWLVRGRTIKQLIKPETLALAATGFIYPLHFLFMPQAMTDSFFGRWVPFISKGYDVYNNPMPYLMRTEVFAVAIIAFVMFIAPMIHKKASTLYQPLAMVIFADLVIYFQQHKGWDYHLYPAYGCIAIAAALGLEDGLPRISKYLRLNDEKGNLKKGAFTGLLLAGAAFIVLPVAVREYKGGFVQIKEPGLVKLINQLTDEGDAVLGLSTSVDLSFPALVQTNRKSGSRYLWCYPVPMLYKGILVNETGAFPYRTDENMPEEEKRFLADLTEDVASFKPKLVLILNRFHRSETCPACPAGFNLYRYFKANGFIDQGLKDYKRIIDGDLVGYVRVNGAGGGK